MGDRLLIDLPPAVAQAIRDALFRQCKRCKAMWLLRPRLTEDGMSILLVEPTRCAKKKCKSKYWNKEYVQKQ